MAVELNHELLYHHMEENFQKGQAYYEENNPQKAIEYFQKALGTCEILSDMAKKAEILYHLGHTYQLRNSAQDFNLAEECYRELLEMDDNEYYIKVQLNRAKALIHRGEYEKAIAIYNELHDSGEVLHIDALLSEIFAYFCLGKFTDSLYFQDAIKYCQKTIEIAEVDGNSLALYYAYHNLGHIYTELGEDVKGMAAFQDSLEYAPAQHERHNTLVDMAVIFIKLSQYDLAKAYIDKAQHHFEKSQDVLGLAGCLFAKGKLNRKRGRIDEAANYLELALSGYREKEYYYGIVKSFLELYELYRRINPEKGDLYYEQYKFYLNYVSPMGVEHIDYISEEDDSMWM